MKKYLTPDFDVTVYEVADKITAEISVQFVEETTTAAPGKDGPWFEG